ncbi:MAG TPA: hypothetical protein VFT50_07730 [Baekduia sp.]|nr:hypothetical protein [Baekduia sp.]
MGILAQGLIVAADAGRGGQDPGAGTSLLLILAIVVAVVVGAAVLFGIFHRLTRASRGGVQPREGEFRRGTPPFESVGRRR